MERVQLDSRIKQILRRVDNQTMSVEQANEEIASLMEDFFYGEKYADEQKAAG